MKFSIKYLVFLLLTFSNFALSQNFWQKIQSPTKNFLRTLYFVDSLKGWVAGDSGDIFFTSDGGLNWIEQETNTTNKIMRLFFLDENKAWALAWADAATGDNLFFGTEILKTNDGGANWSVEQFREENTFLRGIYFLDTLNGFLGGEPAKFLMTTDGGQVWEPANIDSGTFSNFPVINFKFFNQSYGFACGGRFDIAGVIWRTTNGGQNWKPLNPIYSPPDEVWDIHFFDSLQVMGIGGDPDQFGVGIMQSSDTGISWNYFEIGVFGQALSISFRNTNEGWAVVPQTESFVTTYDSGFNWVEYPAPEMSRIYDVMFTDSLTGFAVGEEGVILKYKYQIPDDIGYSKNPIADNFILYQNYPNPFNPITKIKYELSEPAKVLIKVYNILGKHIDTLVDEFKQSGNYDIVWNANSESNGVYYIQMNVDGKLSTKKMILLK